MLNTEILTIYNILNTITKKRTIFLHNNTELAIRQFIKLSNSDVIVKPEELELYAIGKWNERTGELITIKPEFIMTGHFEKQFDDNLKKLIAELVKQELEKITKETN